MTIENRPLPFPKPANRPQKRPAPPAPARTSCEPRTNRVHLFCFAGGRVDDGNKGVAGLRIPVIRRESMAQSTLRVVEGGGMDNTKALDAALSQIERAFGKGSIMRLGKGGKPIEIEAISTGSLGLDIALGIGGLPRGRVVEIYGPESSGKTTLALHCVAEGQKRGGICAFIDAEHALDPVYARKLGINIDALLLSQPDTAAQALEISDTLLPSVALDALLLAPLPAPA